MGVGLNWVSLHGLDFIVGVSFSFQWTVNTQEVQSIRYSISICSFVGEFDLLVNISVFTRGHCVSLTLLNCWEVEMGFEYYIGCTGT